MADDSHGQTRKGGRPRLDPGSTSASVSIRLPTPVFDQLAKVARDRGVSMSEAARGLLIVRLQQQDR